MHSPSGIMVVVVAITITPHHKLKIKDGLSRERAKMRVTYMTTELQTLGLVQLG